MKVTDSNHQKPPDMEKKLPLKEIAEAIQSIKHGYVQIIVQDSRVIQIDKMEKLRLI